MNNIITFIEINSAINDYKAKTIPIVLPTLLNANWNGPLPDIEITCNMPVWRFYSALFNPNIAIK